MKPIHVGSIPLSGLRPERRTELCVIAIGDKFLQTVTSNGPQDASVKLCESPRDAYNWHSKQYALDCAQWLKNMMFQNTGVYVQTYKLFDNGNVEKLQ